MPSRIVREGINSSARICALSMGAELLYRRLMSVVDDFGRYYGAVSTVRAACWPANPDSVKERDVKKWLDECCAGDRPLVTRYRVSGIEYLVINDFQQQVRSKSKFPENETQAKLQQSDSNPPAKREQNSSTSRSRISEAKAEAEATPSPSLPGLTPEEFAAPHPEELGRKLVERLMPNHWKPGDTKLAISTATRLIATSVNPESAMEAICRNHATHVQWHAANPRVYKKSLAYWLSDGDYLHPVKVQNAEDGY